ncbi:MAG: hypothetical protein KJZ68_15830, partial [Phycisphaerales bacterium]|nr:hypothetical protein [Phycisphaerales bacterium]
RGADDARADIRVESDDRTIALQARISELEALLAAAEARAASAVTGKSDQHARELREKAAMLRQAAEHLRRRKSRLSRVRRLLREHARSRSPESIQLASPATTPNRPSREETEERMRLAARIQQEREALAEAARALAASEKAMIRRWARPRAVATVAWLTIMAALVGVGSWFAADQFFPAVYTASVTIQAQPRPGFPLTDEQAAQWQLWHAGQLEDDAFLRTAARRYADRQMPMLSDDASLRSHLKAHLTTDSTRDGELVLTMSGSDQPTLLTTLDTLAMTLVSESRRQAGKRPDGARTELVGEHQQDGQTRYAQINPTPIEDRRLERAGVIFGAGYAALLLLTGLAYVRLSRAKRIFDETDPAAEPIG